MFMQVADRPTVTPKCLDLSTAVPTETRDPTCSRWWYFWTITLTTTNLHPGANLISGGAQCRPSRPKVARRAWQLRQTGRVFGEVQLEVHVKYDWPMIEKRWLIPVAKAIKWVRRGYSVPDQISRHNVVFVVIWNVVSDRERWLVVGLGWHS